MLHNSSFMAANLIPFWNLNTIETMDIYPEFGKKKLSSVLSYKYSLSEDIQTDKQKTEKIGL